MTDAMRNLLLQLILTCLQLRSCDCFVLTPPAATPYGLAGSARRWDARTLSRGLRYVVASDLCTRLRPSFSTYLFETATCDAIEASLLAATRKWTDNLPLLRFVNATSSSAACTVLASAAELYGAPRQAEMLLDEESPCAFDIFFGVDDGRARPSLAAYARVSTLVSRGIRSSVREVRSPNGQVYSNIDAIKRGEVRIQTHVCYYLDASFCRPFHVLQSMGAAFVVPFVAFLIFALANLCAVGLIIRGCCCERLHERLQARASSSRWYGLSAVLDAFTTELTRLRESCCLVAVVWLLALPLIAYAAIYLPCANCYDFEAVVAHEIGHVLGFSHPDEAAAGLNRVASCRPSNATCLDPFACASPAPFDGTSIMQSLTVRASSACLSTDDAEGLRMLYPVCDGSSLSTPAAAAAASSSSSSSSPRVSCTQPRLYAGWLRFALTAGWTLAASLLVLACIKGILALRARRLVASHRRRTVPEALAAPDTLDAPRRHDVSTGRFNGTHKQSCAMNADEPLSSAMTVVEEIMADQPHSHLGVEAREPRDVAHMSDATAEDEALVEDLDEDSYDQFEALAAAGAADRR